jgi:predicted alpha/beta-hydrolase family hydrolase
MKEIPVDVHGARVTASLFGEPPLGTVVVLGHGAGGDRRTPFLVRLATLLAEGGRGAALYNFPYTERGGKRADPPALLEATTQAVHAAVREAFGARKLVAGGKSMGGRIASQAVAKGAPADGLVFLGYPLHPPGKPEQLRDAHLPALAVPMLFVEGTRDAFARWDLLTALLERLGPRATLHRIEEGNHSFAVPKRTGLTNAAVEREIQITVAAWLAANRL